jgi:hypothetical protein
MIEFGGCEKSQLQDACETLAAQLIQYEHPTWYEIKEEDICQKLKEEGLPVIRF